MAESLAALRAAVARETGLLISGTATGGSTSTIIDINRLAEYDELGAFRRTLAYIRTDAGGASAAPEGEARFVTAYSGQNKQLTVAPVFSAAVAAGDTYEVYLAPFEIATWNQAVNLAIREAWPQVYGREISDVTATGSDSYSLPNSAEELLAVLVIMADEWVGFPGQLIPPNAYQVTGTPGSDLYCRFLNTVPANRRTVRFITKARFGELATNATTTDLDREYIVAAAAAHMYQALAGEAGGQADAARYVQLMAHWQQVAGQRKQELAAGLLGTPAGGGKQK